jgi:septal ring factor EnvC (AmiA/AmiB activator)
VYFIAREDDIRKIRDRMDNQIKGREREIAHTTEKIGQAQFELKKLSKKSTQSEADRLQTLERKIANTEFKSKELLKEIKMLKKLQHDKSVELIEMDIKEEYPEKVRSLMEEVRWNKDKQIDLEYKIELEER